MQFLNPFKNAKLYRDSTSYISYLDFFPMTIPFLGNLSSGINSFLTGLPFNRAIQKKKSTGFSLLRLKTQFPNCLPLISNPLLNFLLYMFDTLTSTDLPFHSKSTPFVNSKCLAPKNLAAHFSHLKPIPVDVFQKSGFPLKYVFLLGYLRKYHDLFIHTTEQYLYRFSGSFLLQKRHLVGVL
jgi:hypothetical protein